MSTHFYNCATEYCSETKNTIYILSLSNQQIQDIEHVSEEMDKARKELEQVVITKEEEERYLQMIAETKAALGETEEGKKKPVSQIRYKLRSIGLTWAREVNRIRRGDDRKRVIGRKLKRKEGPSKWTTAWNSDDNERKQVATKDRPHDRIEVTRVSLRRNLGSPNGTKEETVTEWTKPNQETQKAIEREAHNPKHI